MGPEIRKWDNGSRPSIPVRAMTMTMDKRMEKKALLHPDSKNQTVSPTERKASHP